MIYEAHVARSKRDFEQVRALRRDAFEVELGYSYAGLDDSIDDHSTVMLWARGERAVGTARLTGRADGPLEDESVLELERWKAPGGFTDAEIGQCSRLVVTPELRGRGVDSHMIAGLYTAAERRGLALVFIDASTPLLSYYRRIGFRPFCRPYAHPTLHMEIHPRVLFIGDSDYFDHLGSRLYRLAPADTAARARSIYQQQFGRYACAG